MKIVPSALIDSITQTSGGTTIQNSYGGLQLHKKAVQKKRKTVAQQNARQAFTNVQSAWRDLSPEEQATWSSAAPSGTSGFELYSSTNNRLVNQGSNINNEYVAPVTPPTNDLEFYSATANYVEHPFYYNATYKSPGNNLPTSGWLAYIKWTGWIQGSQYRYPEPKFVVPQEGIIILDEDEIFFEITESMNSSFRNFQEGSKAQFIVGIMNTTTGQIEQLLVHEQTI